MRRLSGLLLAGALATVTSVAVPAVASASPSNLAGGRTQQAVLPIGTQLAELGPKDGGSSGWFGTSVAASGDTAVVGAPSASEPGRAYVFTKKSSGWSQVAELAASDGVPDDWFGGSVAVSGSTIVVGASYGGTVYVFTQSLSGWRQAVELENPVPGTDEFFGESVAISGSTIVVGADGASGGVAYLFTRTGTGWHETAELQASNEPDGFGSSVAISGNIIVIGAQGNLSWTGAAYVFTKAATGWRQAAELYDPGTSMGGFGVSVAVSGGTVVVGEEGFAGCAERAFVFTESSGAWSRGATLGPDIGGCDYFGDDVAISGNTIVVGASQHEWGGRAYVFTKTAVGWQRVAEQGPDAGDPNASFGRSVAISGSTVLVGDDDSSKAYAFEG